MAVQSSPALPSKCPTFKTDCIVRNLRKEEGVPEKERLPVVAHAIPAAREAFTANLDRNRETRPRQIARLFRLRPRCPGVSRHFSYFAAKVIYERTVDVPAERERLTKDIARYEKGLAAAERQLGNEGFLAKAPAHVVEGLKKQEAETRLLLEKARAALGALPKE